MEEKNISQSNITGDGHYGEADSRDNVVMGAAEGAEATATASTQQTCQPDIHSVLSEMSALKVELRQTSTQMEALETKLKVSENKAVTMISRLRASENKAETMESRLRASENLVEQLKGENKALAMDLNRTVSQVEELRRERKERRVSFSASLLASGSGHTGPFSRATPLVYKNIYTNIGNAYNPTTGMFTAPVRGVYYFALHAYGVGHQGRPVAVSLNKNGDHIVIAYGEHLGAGYKTSNGASLQLEVGDVVNANLWPGGWVHDSRDHHNTFSGHLLFLM